MCVQLLHNADTVRRNVLSGWQPRTVARRLCALEARVRTVRCSTYTSLILDLGLGFAGKKLICLVALPPCTTIVLRKEELADLRAAHCGTRIVRETRRINPVMLLGNGRSTADVADALLVDAETVRASFNRY